VDISSVDVPASEEIPLIIPAVASTEVLRVEVLESAKMLGDDVPELTVARIVEVAELVEGFGKPLELASMLTLELAFRLATEAAPKLALARGVVFIPTVRRVEALEVAFTWPHALLVVPFFAVTLPLTVAEAFEVGVSAFLLVR